MWHLQIKHTQDNCYTVLEPCRDERPYNTNASKYTTINLTTTSVNSGKDVNEIIDHKYTQFSSLFY